MADVYVAIGYAQGRTTGGAPIPLRKGSGVRSVAKITSSVTSQKPALVATQAEVNDGAVWLGKVVGGTVHICAGISPVAVATNSHTYGDGDIFELTISTVGEELAILSAA